MSNAGHDAARQSSHEIKPGFIINEESTLIREYAYYLAQFTLRIPGPVPGPI